MISPISQTLLPFLVDNQQVGSFLRALGVGLKPDGELVSDGGQPLTAVVEPQPATGAFDGLKSTIFTARQDTSHNLHPEVKAEARGFRASALCSFSVAPPLWRRTSTLPHRIFFYF